VCNTNVTSAAPFSSLSTVSVTESDDVVDSTVELFGVTSCSITCSVTSSSLSQTLDVELCENITANPLSPPVTDPCQTLEVKPLAFSESSTDLSQYSGDISLNSEILFDDQKSTSDSLRNSRNVSSSSLPEMGDNRRHKSGTNQNRKRKHEDEIPEYAGLTFDKLPNYYTALAIPSRVMAGSAARSSSDLLADFMNNERDPSPERKSCSVYDKLPAYYSSFTNSTRYDDQSLQSFETNFCQYEAEDEGRYGRSCDDNYELQDLKSAEELAVVDDSPNEDCGEEEETNTENVSCVIIIVMLLLLSSIIFMELVSKSLYYCALMFIKILTVFSSCLH